MLPPASHLLVVHPQTSTLADEADAGLQHNYLSVLWNSHTNVRAEGGSGREGVPARRGVAPECTGLASGHLAKLPEARLRSFRQGVSWITSQVEMPKVWHKKLLPTSGSLAQERHLPAV
ncbi:hypothetical protein A1O3_07410 [Capronia epimyces CBS 606.96]|uniref:Uncharacterized protein n=1 Tax=Capronia epimyces CBS 606.96 TaxID=1182542 RepID=W9XKR6_9EURO|nr:uncharacterized protein A1O3_07410 [Capronia epimyces CBS 606.96]EXJ81122.1 hypothetical protein A1O3_07410 [Capronia epimyces CBS 606.96]